MQALDLPQRFHDPATPWTGRYSEGCSRPLFIIGKPFNGEDHHLSNGQMVALLATSREEVRRVFENAFANGGASEGESALRPHYGTYSRDPKGNKLCIVRHSPE